MTQADRALVDRFLDMMAAEMGAARNTLAAYRSDLAAAAADLGSLEAAGSKDLAVARRAVGRAGAVDRGAARGGAAALLRFPA